LGADAWPVLARRMTFRPASANCSSTGHGGTFCGVGRRERAYDQRHGVGGRGGWSRPVHLRRGDGPARTWGVEDHTREPCGAGCKGLLVR
jgi:hypothetical protein